MFTMRVAFASLVLVAGPAMAADPAKYIHAELIAESAAPRPSSTILVGFRMTPKAGWHGYWSNPGESGFAPSVRWTAPAGVTFGPLLHPAPSLLKVSGMSSFVHEGPHILLTRLTVARAIPPGTPIPVTAAVNWAACTATQCVPLRATLRLDLNVGNGARNADAPALAAAKRKLPRTAPAGSFAVDGKTVRLKLPASLRLDPRRVRFFPDDSGAFDATAARATAEGRALFISGKLHDSPPNKISGVVSDGRGAYRLAFVQGDVADVNEAAKQPAARELTADPPSQPADAARTIFQRTPVQAPAEPASQRSWSLLLLLAGAAIVAATLGVRFMRRHRPRM